MVEQTSGLSWNVMTHEHQPRSTDWYWALGLLAVLGGAISLYLNDVLLMLILLLGAGSLGFLTARGPREHAIHIDPRGVTVDGTMYPYAGIHAFSIGEHSGRISLILSISSLLTPHMILPLENMSPEVVRMTLRRYCTEREFEPRLIDTLTELAGL